MRTLRIAVSSVNGGLMMVGAMSDLLASESRFEASGRQLDRVPATSRIVAAGGEMSASTAGARSTSNVRWAVERGWQPGKRLGGGWGQWSGGWGRGSGGGGWW